MHFQLCLLLLISSFLSAAVGQSSACPSFCRFQVCQFWWRPHQPRTFMLDRLVASKVGLCDVTGAPGTFLDPALYTIGEALVAKLQTRRNKTTPTKFRPVSQLGDRRLSHPFPPDLFKLLPIYFPPSPNQYGLAHSGLQGNQNKYLYKICVIIPLSERASELARSNDKEIYNGEPREDCVSTLTFSAPLFISLSWNSIDDLDLALIEPDGNKIFYDNKNSNTGGRLIWDRNGYGNITCTGVAEPSEEISYRYPFKKTSSKKPLPGTYTVLVTHITNCGLGKTDFNVAVIVDGVLKKTVGGVSNAENGKKILEFTFELPSA